MKNNTSASPQKFLLFPRFVQLFLNAQVTNLPTDGMLMPLTRMQKRIFDDCRLYGKCEAPTNVPLFGHLVDPAYQKPIDDNWVEAQQQAQEQSTTQPLSPHHEPAEKFVPQHDEPAEDIPHADDVTIEDVADDDDDSIASSGAKTTERLNARELAALQRVVPTSRFHRLQQVSLLTSSRRQRHDDSDSDFDLEDQPLVCLRRVDQPIT